MTRNKEFAFSHHADMITRSWTYSRMTEKEKDGWFNVAHDAVEQGVITGTYDHRFKILNALYSAYLNGIGYSGHTWREPNPESVPF